MGLLKSIQVCDVEAVSPPRVQIFYGKAPMTEVRRVFAAQQASALKNVGVQVALDPPLREEFEIGVRVRLPRHFLRLVALEHGLLGRQVSQFNVSATEKVRQEV